MPTPRVIDLSHHNTVPQDFTATKAAGIVGLIHKLTEGTGYTDDKCAARYYLAQQAGLAWGVYHFMRPGDPIKQADFFLKKGLDLGVIDDHTALVADHEDAGVPATDLKKWLDYVEDMMGRSPIVYSGDVLKDQLKGQGYRPTRRLWLCQYTSGTPSLPEGVSAYWLWQYTDKGTIAGVNAPVDLNHFEGDAAPFLEGWAGIRGQGPQPQPPETVVPTLTLSSDRPVRIHIGPNIEIV